MLEDPPPMDRPPSPVDINKGLFVTNEEQPAQYGWQWLSDLRALPREERIAGGFVMNPNWAEEEIIPWADSKAELKIDILEPAFGRTVRWRISAVLAITSTATAMMKRWQQCALF